MSTSIEDQLAKLLSEDYASAVERERSTFDEVSARFQQRLVLFGAGNLGRKVLHILRCNRVEPLAFSDNASSLWGQEIDGVKVLSPHDAAHQFGGSTTFVITIFNRESSFLSIKKQLLDLSCVNVVPFCSLLWKYSYESLPHMLVDSPHRILAHKDEIRKVFALLGDDMSRREYVAQIRWRLLQDYDGLLPPIIQEQYFPDDIFTLSPNEVFIDCGAYDGDTIKALIQRRTDFKSIIAIEPDPINFERLQEYLSELPSTIKNKISPLRLAVGASKGKVHFEASGTLGSKLSDRGETEVECDFLDSLIDGCYPTYIKMDIEGAELDALKGASGIMQENHTIWAVCVYHKPEDLWQIPLFISSRTEDYRFFLRKYMGEMWESVCYAVPRKRLF